MSQKAIVELKNGQTLSVRVIQSYSHGGIHYYTFIINALKTFLDFESGEKKMFTGEEITKLTYVMG